MSEPRTSWIVTAVFVATAISGDAVAFMRTPAAIVAVAMFLGGSALMFATIIVAARRSRTENIGIGGLFFLAESAPREVQLQLMGSFGVQCLVGFATAAARPTEFSTAAFGVLAPVAGLGFAGLWGARHGTFGPRNPEKSASL